MLPLVIISVLFAAAPSANALWPLPQQLSTGTSPLRLSSSFSIKVSGIRGATPKDLTDAIGRTQDYLRKDKLQALVPDRGASSAGAIKGAKQLKTLTLSLTSSGKVKSISEEAVQPLESRVESYTLTIPADGSEAVLKANSTLGLFRGLTTFGQLWYDWQDSAYTLQAPVNIADFPAYVCSISTIQTIVYKQVQCQPYRGFMLDTARN